MDNEKEREEFEAWLTRGERNYGKVVDDDLRALLFATWQSCAAKKDAEIVKLQRKLAAYEAEPPSGWRIDTGHGSDVKLNNPTPEYLWNGKPVWKALILHPSTTEHLDALLKAERERCAKVCELAMHSAGTTPADCLSAIRALD